MNPMIGERAGTRQERSSRAKLRWVRGIALGLSAMILATSPGVLRAQQSMADRHTPAPEVRGTWVTTTANDAISSARNTAQTMQRLRDIGLNTVYVECWKNGYTQFPSEVLKRVIGVDRRPALMKQDPSDSPEAARTEGRDLLGETLTEAHRNGLIYIAWFEYGFMAAHKDTMNHLRKAKPEWLSRDINGNEVAPNGFVWMNPLHPEARRFLLDLVLEAVDKYDLDGVQLDDRIVWPYVTMGYDDYTRKAYAKEHDGKEPPADPKDPEWMRWRADKVNEYARMFVSEVRARRPGLLISLSPAVYPWVWDNYLLEWPKWAGWDSERVVEAGGVASVPRGSPGAGWDEFVPQNYRFSYDAFEKTWLEQVKWMNQLGARRQGDLYPGIRIVGEGKDSTWDQLRRSIELARSNGNPGHVLWFSRGVLDVYPKELAEFYQVGTLGPAPHPKFAAGWRPAPIRLTRASQYKGGDTWTTDAAGVPPGEYQAIGKFQGQWRAIPLTEPMRQALRAPRDAKTATISIPVGWIRGEPLPAPKPGDPILQSNGFENLSYDEVELLVDRRPENSQPRRVDGERPRLK